MADIKLLMVTDGARFNFGTQPTTSLDVNFFGLSALVAALRGSTTPTIQVDTAHRRGATFAAPNDPDTSVNLTYHGDFLFTSIDLTQYDVLWLIGDEGYNGGFFGTAVDSKITVAEWNAIASFMQGGGGVFAVGDHDGIGQYMCGLLPRVRVMRRWYYWSNLDNDPNFSQFIPNWSNAGTAASAVPGGLTDRFDTLQPDSLDGNWYFVDQSDEKPQTLMTSTGTPLASAPAPDSVHPLLRAANGAVIAKFPDHMHEGEATDFNSASAVGGFNPNDVHDNPISIALQDSAAGRFLVTVPTGQAGSVVEFPSVPSVGGYQPVPQVISYGADSGHPTYLQGVDPTTGMPMGASAAKTGTNVRGNVSVYDGRAVGIGRIITGSTFHHYLDKNLIGDPLTQSTTAGVGPTDSNLGLQPPDFDSANPALPSAIGAYYINAVTWLARPNSAFYFWTERNTFGSDENQNGASYPNAFYLALEGLAPSVVGNPVVALSGPFAAAGAMFQQGSAILSGSASTPQRILFPFTVKSIPQGAFPTTAPPTVLALEARVTIGMSIYDAEALFELTPGADPYFTNVDGLLASPNPPWLSQDLCVMQVTPGVNPVPLVSFPPGAPFAYMANLLNYLNNPVNGFTSDAGTDPFQTLSEANALTEESSVTPTVSGQPSYNFAIARVRLRGSTAASNVKVFFRLFATQTNDTDYAPDSTYLSTLDSSNLPDEPLPGTDQTSYPFFASSTGATGDNAAGLNDVTILGLGTTHESWKYFGCYLNVYSMPPSTFPGTHHCLVAQIAYDPAPILNSNGLTLSPENSDKLAQRNLQITPA